MLSIFGLDDSKHCRDIPFVINFMKWIKNRKIDKITKHGNDMYIVSIGNEAENVNINIITLYQSVVLRESLNDMIITRPSRWNRYI